MLRKIPGTPRQIMVLREWVKVKVAQSCPTLCNPMGYTVHGILHARMLEWVAVPFSRGSSQHRDRTQTSCTAGRFFTSWATREAPIFQRTVAFLWKCMGLRVEGSEDSGATEIDDCERQHDRETIDELKFKPHISQLRWKLWDSSVYWTKSDVPSRWGEDVFSPTLPQGPPEQRQGIS